MPWPPNIPPGTRADSTEQQANHPSDHNLTSVALDLTVRRTQQNVESFTADSSATFTITFPEPFEAVPTVTAAVSGTSFRFIGITSVTTTGFTGVVRTIVDGAIQPDYAGTCQWIAVGDPTDPGNPVIPQSVEYECVSAMAANIAVPATTNTPMIYDLPLTAVDWTSGGNIVVPVAGVYEITSVQQYEFTSSFPSTPVRCRNVVTAGGFTLIGADYASAPSGIAGNTFQAYRQLNAGDVVSVQAWQATASTKTIDGSRTMLRVRRVE